MTHRSFRIVMFCPQLRPAIGGAERQAERLAKALVARGHRVTIVTPRMDAASPVLECCDGVVIERFQLTDLACRCAVPGIAVVNVPYMLWQVARALRVPLATADVLHCHIASLQTAGAALAARMVGVPVLCKAATADQRSDLGEIERSGASGPMIARLTRALVESWVATTAAVEEALVRAGIDRTRIERIPNGIAPSAARGNRRRIRRFLYLGRVATNAGRDVATLIRAFDRIAMEHADLELAIVGGGDQLAQARHQAAACAARDRIQLPGVDDASRWLAWADCFVFPSRREGMSNALLEAMAAGLPCIANDIPPNREVLDDGRAGILVAPEDRAALEAAMRAMIQGGGAALSELGRARASDCYSIDLVATRYAALYHTLARGASTP